MTAAKGQEPGGQSLSRLRGLGRGDGEPACTEARGEPLTRRSAPTSPRKRGEVIGLAAASHAFPASKVFQVPRFVPAARSRPGCASVNALETSGGRREGRVPAAPAAPVRKKSTGKEPQVKAETSGLPCAMVLRFIRALPGDRACLPPSRASRSRSVSRTWCQRRGTRTTRFHRPQKAWSSCAETAPKALASITSRLALRDDREPPLMAKRDGRDKPHFRKTKKENIFRSRTGHWNQR
jgi:hypothetical protein